MPSCPTRCRLEHQSSFRNILLPHSSIGLHPCDMSSSLTQATKDYLTEGAQSLTRRGYLPDLEKQLQSAFSERTRSLLTDILETAALYRDISGHQALRVRLEKITTDSCRKFHVDCVDLRLLRTYAGPGVQWTTDNGSTVHQAPTGALVFLKGKHFPGWDKAEKILHRSPPLSDRPINERIRLLLTLDEASACADASLEMAA